MSNRPPPKWPGLCCMGWLLQLGLLSCCSLDGVSKTCEIKAISVESGCRHLKHEIKMIYSRVKQCCKTLIFVSFIPQFLWSKQECEFKGLSTLAENLRCSSDRPSTSIIFYVCVCVCGGKLKFNKLQLLYSLWGIKGAKINNCAKLQSISVLQYQLSVLCYSL